MNSRLSPLDVNFWSLDSQVTPQVIATYCLLEFAPEIEQVRAAVCEQLKLFPKMSQRIEWRWGWSWVDFPEFDLKKHVRSEVIPEVQDLQSLQHAAEAHFCSPLDHRIPLWDFVILSGNSGSSPAGTMFRIHHSLADGLGGFEFFHRVCHVETMSEGKLKAHSGGAQSAKTVKPPPQFSLNFARSAGRLLQEIRSKHRQSLLNGTNSEKRELRVFDIPQKELREVRKKLGASANDVLLALVASALRGYQICGNERAENVKALIPFSIRRRQNALTLGNHITGVAVELPVELQSTFERVKHLRKSINGVKLDGSFGAFKILGLLNGYLPGPLRRFVGIRAARRTNLICTNMMGPEKPLFLANARILANYGCAALLHGQGVAFAFVSYAGNMHVSFIFDPQIVHAPDLLLKFFVNSWKELREAAQETVKSAFN